MEGQRQMYQTKEQNKSPKLELKLIYENNTNTKSRVLNKEYKVVQGLYDKNG